MILNKSSAVKVVLHVCFNKLCSNLKISPLQWKLISEKPSGLLDLAHIRLYDEQRPSCIGHVCVVQVSVVKDFSPHRDVL